jgi:hypothetical protein
MTYNFDIAYDCPVQDFLSILEQHNLSIESFIPIGPGGGNPNITVTGTQTNIEKFKQFYN